MDIPAITRTALQEQFPFHAREPIDSYIWDSYNPSADAWVANRIWCICYECGFIRFKNTIRETYKCPRCKTRNVVMMRAGEIAKVIRDHNMGATKVGTYMVEIFEARKERLKQLRKAKKDLHELE